MRSKIPWRGDDFDIRSEDWPRSFDLIGCSAPLLIGLGVLIQRDALFDPGRATLLVAVAVVPWLLQLRGILLPLWLSAAIVTIPVFLLIQATANDAGIEDISPFLLVVLAMGLGAFAPLLESMVLTALVLLATAVAFEAGPDVGGHHVAHWTHALPWYIGIGGGWMGGVLLQGQLRVMRELKAAQADLAKRAAAEERQRIAHDLHDVIAHSLTVTLLHVTGARKALQNDRSDAIEAMEEAERLGRQSLADVRQVVGVLKMQGESDTAALPDATDISTLVREVSAAGADVRLDTVGDVRAIAPTTGLALYRVLQESLTNVAKHAPGAPARVHLDVNNGTVSLSVSNPLPERSLGTDSSADSLGLWGMKERVQVVGGTFEAGPREDQWVVEVTAPTASS